MSLESLSGGLTRLQQSDLAGAALWISAGLAESDLSAAGRSLLLHLSALLHFAEGNLQASSTAFAEAARLENAQGWTTGAQHTSHQWALLSPEGSSLSKAKKYYKESLHNLRRTRNRLGAGLCLRSLGELAALTGYPDQAATFWKAGAKSLRQGGTPEFEQLEGWVKLLESSLNQT